MGGPLRRSPVRPFSKRGKKVKKDIMGKDLAINGAFRQLLLLRHEESISEDDYFQIRREIDKIRIPPAKESLYALGVPMGTSDLLSSNVPAWKVTFLEGEFDNNTVSGTLEIDNRNINIPQLNINFTNKMIA